MAGTHAAQRSLEISSQSVSLLSVRQSAGKHNAVFPADTLTSLLTTASTGIHLKNHIKKEKSPENKTGIEAKSHMRVLKGNCEKSCVAKDNFDFVGFLIFT